MKLNAVEKAAMNNPLRRALQRHYEIPLLQRLASSADSRGGGRLVPGSRGVEIGCGQGYGAQLALERLGVATLDAVDLDEGMVTLARRRLAGHAGVGRIIVGDATDLGAALDAADGSYDLVLDFGTFHHLPHWRAGLAEAARVLRPGGRLYYEEVTDQALSRWVYRTFTDHPPGGHFTADEFTTELTRLGLQPAAATTRLSGDFLLGVACRTET